MMRSWLLTLVPLLVLLTPLRGGASSLEDVFKQSNNAFWNGEYAAALEGYQKLEKLGIHNAVLCYNMGTAYARLGKLGPAVHQYERALRLDPGQDDTRHNLSVIREYIARRASEAGRDADLSPAAGPWRAVLDRFSSGGAALGFLILHLALFLVLAIRRFVFAEMPRLSLGVLAGVLCILTVAMFSVAVGKWHQDKYHQEAVVVADGPVDAMEGPSSEVKRFSVEEGSRIRIMEQTATWTRLMDSEGRDGWVPAESLGII